MREGESSELRKLPDGRRQRDERIVAKIQLGERGEAAKRVRKRADAWLDFRLWSVPILGLE